MLLGYGFERVQVEAVTDPQLPVSRSMNTSDMVKSQMTRRALGKSDSEAVEDVLLQGVGTLKVPGAVWLRRQMDVPVPKPLSLADELSLRLLVHA